MPLIHLLAPPVTKMQHIKWTTLSPLPHEKKWIVIFIQKNSEPASQKLAIYHTNLLQHIK